MRSNHREAQALDFLRCRPCASALEIGKAATAGERRSHSMSWQAKEAIGLAIASRLVERGLARATRGNLFRMVSPWGTP